MGVRCWVLARREQYFSFFIIHFSFMNKESSYLAKLDNFFYQGLSLESQNMSAEQKMRTKIVYEAYNRWMQNKQVSTYDLLRRIAAREYQVALMKAREGDSYYQEIVKACNIVEGKVRTATELRSDAQAFNHIIEYLSVDERAIDKMKVHDSADFLMREGKKAGNFQAVNQGAKILMDLNGNFEERENAADQMPKMISITSDVTTIRRDRANLTEEETRKIANRVGMSDQQVQDLFLQSDGVYRLYEGEENEDEDLDPIIE